MEFLANQAGKSDQDCEYIPLDHRLEWGMGTYPIKLSPTVMSTSVVLAA
jgi:hypothetical protein